MGVDSTESLAVDCKARKPISVFLAYISRLIGAFLCLAAYQNYGIDRRLSNIMGISRSSDSKLLKPDDSYLWLLTFMIIVLFFALGWRQMQGLFASLVSQDHVIHSWPPMRAGEECCQRNGFRLVRCLGKVALFGMVKGFVFLAFWIALHHLAQLLLLQIGATSASLPGFRNGTTSLDEGQIYEALRAIANGNDQQVIGNFIEWFGILYGLIFAAVLVEVWSQFKTVEHNLDREADDLLMLYETAQLLDNNHDSTRRELTALMIAYAYHVKNCCVKEYRIKDRNSSLEKRNGDKFLRDLRKLIKTLIRSPHGEYNAGSSQNIILQELIRRENDLFEARGDRISSAESHLPIPLLVLLTSSSIIWLLAFFGLPVQSNSLAALLVAGVAYIILSLFEIIADLNSPYDGMWKVDMSSLNDFIITVDEDELSFV